MHIVDRRLNPSGKNLANRQRFMRRAKSLIRKAVHESSGQPQHQGRRRRRRGRRCRRRGCTSPRSSVAPAAASATTCCPATRSTSRATPSRGRQGGAGGGGSEGSPDGEGEDDFRFALSRDEFVDLFLEDLELPDLAKRRVVNAEAVTWHRAGYSVTGSPANLALNRTVRNSLSRRIALRRPKPEELQALRDEIAALEPRRRGRGAARWNWRKS